jgi:predicted ATPase
MAAKRAVPQIEELTVGNYRALQSIHFRRLTPLTVLLGSNGSGKSTVFDVFAFLSECFTIGLRKAWDKRGRFKELRTRGATGVILFELKYRETSDSRLITYHLEIDEGPKGPYVAKEWLRWTLRTRGSGRPFNFLDFTKGSGSVISGDAPEEPAQRVPEHLDSPEMLAVNTLGQLARNPRVAALRRFITSWYLSYLTADSTRVTPEAGPQERLSITGDNLPNVIQYLKEQHPERLEDILRTLKQRVPRLDRVDAEILADGRLLLQIKDAPFEKPIQAKFASDGTLKMLAYLTVLYDPEPPQFIGIEEPENHLHPRLLPELAEECRLASERSQLMVTTHSPFFINTLQPDEVWVLSRDRKGYATAHNVAAMKGIKDLVQEGAQLGQLWIENHFEVGDPLSESRGQGVLFS